MPHQFQVEQVVYWVAPGDTSFYDSYPFHEYNSPKILVGTVVGLENGYVESVQDPDGDIITFFVENTTMSLDPKSVYKKFEEMCAEIQDMINAQIIALVECKNKMRDQYGE